MTDKENPRIRSVVCGICDHTFTDGTVVEIAKQVASHWNNEHGDELEHSMQPFKTEQYGGRHLHGDEYAYRLHKEYVTVYDVLDTSGHTCGPFAYEYVKEPEAENHCEDCWRHIRAVDGYRELDTTGWRDKYLCDDCAKERKIKRRMDNNQKLTEWVA